MASIQSWSTTPGSNANSDSDFSMAEGMQAGALNDGVRWIMARVAQFLETLGCVAQTTGSPNGRSVFVASPFTAYSDGLIVGFESHVDNSGPTNLSVNGGPSRAIKKHVNNARADVGAGDIQNNGKYLVIYDNSEPCWLIVNPSYGATFQPKDDTLTALANKTGSIANNKMLYFSGGGASTITDLTAFARTVLAAANVADFKTAIDLVQTGGSNAATDFPIGHTLACASSTVINRNNSCNPRIDDSNNRSYRTGGGGAALSGNWSARGEITSGVYLVQRVS